MNDLAFKESAPTGEEFIKLVKSTSWEGIIDKGAAQLEKALRSSWYVISAYDNGDIIGTGRIVSDGVFQAFICDLIVLPAYQGKGIGSEILMKLLHKCKENQILMVQLFAAKGKYQYYRKFGFEERPEDAPGMRWVNKNI